MYKIRLVFVYFTFLLFTLIDGKHYILAAELCYADKVQG